MSAGGIIRRRKLLVTVAAVALAHAPVLARDIDSAASIPAVQSRAIEVPLSLNGFYLGDISVQLTKSGEFQKLDGQRLANLLKERADKPTLDAIATRLAGDRFVSVHAVSLDGLSVTFDPANLQVDVKLASARTPVQEISLGSGGPASLRDALQPSGLSGALNVSFAKHWIQKSKLNPELEGPEPLTASLDGYFNLGGLDGVYLFHEWSFDGARGHKLQRGPTTLVRDFVNSSIRLSVGDLTPATSYFQGSTQLAGIQIGTAYAEIQPNRNIRPAGHSDFVLDRTSRIDVQVNGTTLRTLTLSPGRYDLRDLSLAEGSNDVRLMVEDSSGRRELISFSGLFSSELLARGLTDFSLAAGFAREPSSTGFSYHTGRPKLTGIIKRGLTDTLTAGANLQLGRGIANVGTEVIAALPIGTLTAQLSGSSAHGRTGIASAAGVRYSRSQSAYPTDVEFLWRYRSARYHGLDEADLRNDIGHELSANLRQSLPYSIYASAGASYAHSRARGAQPRYSLSLGRPFGRMLANVFFDQSRNIDGEVQRSVVASLSLRFGSRSNVRAQYRSRTNERVVEYERTSYNGLGEWGTRAGFNRSATGTALQGSLDIYANRGDFGVRTGMIEGANGDRVIDTTFRGAMALAFAGGHFAVGRPVHDGFAIVRRHRTLKDRRISIPAGSFSLGSLASTDFLGSALVPLSRSYQAQQFDVAVHDLPVGYDAGASRFTVFQGARSGVAITVGSDAVNSVLGNLAYRDGDPVALIAGVLRPLGKKDAAVAGGDVEFFTNRTGRFAAEKLRPGTYAIVVSSVETGATLSIPEDSNGLVQVGKIMIERR